MLSTGESTKHMEVIFPPHLSQSYFTLYIINKVMPKATFQFCVFSTYVYVRNAENT